SQTARICVLPMECLCSRRHHIACVGLEGLPHASSCGRRDGEGGELGVVTGRLACATVSGNARDSKWGPAPTVGQQGSAVRSLAHQLCWFCLFEAAFGRDRSAPAPPYAGLFC